MFPPSIYQPTYLTVATVLALICFSQYNNKKGAITVTNSHSIGGIILTVFYVLFIGLRPTTGKGLSDAFGDTVNYISHYNLLEGSPFFFSFDTENVIFDNLFSWWASENLGITPFFLLCNFLYFACAYKAIVKMFPEDRYAVFLVFLTAFSAYSASVNAVKAGVAGSIFLLALAYRQNLIISIPLVLISLGFHHSMNVLVAAYICCMIVKRPKYFYFAWIFSLCMALAHVTYFQVLFAGFTDDHGASYLLSVGENWGGKSTGFRFDFVLYSVMPLIMGWYAIKKRRINDNLYNFILSVYIFSNSIWLLCMYASFTNRIAYLSWFMYPIVIVYPCLLPQFGADRYKVFAKVATLHLAFTIFMNVVYYG